MRNSTRLLIGVVLSLMTLPTMAGVIAFDEGPVIQSGTITYGGNGGALVGTDIAFNTATGDATPLQQGALNALTCSNCELDFITGLNTVEGPAVWQWLAGGSFTLTGDLYQGATLLDSGTLLDGEFTGSPTAVGSGNNRLFASIGDIAASIPLTDYFGIGSVGYQFAHTDLSLDGCAAYGASGGFMCDLNNADLAVSAAEVPEPTPLALMGLGLLAIGASARRLQS